MLLNVIKKITNLLQNYSEQQACAMQEMFTVEKGIDAVMFFHYNSVLFFTTKRGTIW